MLGCHLVKHDSKLGRVSRNLKLAESSPPCPFSLLLIVFYLLSLPLLSSLVWFSPPLFSPVLITKVDLYQLEDIYIYIFIFTHDGLIRPNAHGDLGHLYYYLPTLSPLTSVRGLPTQIPAPPFACAENRIPMFLHSPSALLTVHTLSRRHN